MKKVITLAFASLLVLPVAANADVFNTMTGEDSHNWAQKNSSEATVIDVSNRANVDNDIDSEVDTGGNGASAVSSGFFLFGWGGDNTVKRTTVDTGDATSEIGVTNNLNGTDITVAADDAAAEEDVYNSETGEDSNNEAELNEGDIVGVGVTNRANADNDVDAEVETGDSGAEAISSGGDNKVKDTTVTTGSGASSIFTMNVFNVLSLSL